MCDQLFLSAFLHLVRNKLYTEMFTTIPEPEILHDDELSEEERVMRGMDLGFSPRTSSRVIRTLVLPVPDVPLTREYMSWCPEGQKFKFMLMSVETWTIETGATLRMYSQSFDVHGRPLLLWRHCYSLAPRN